MSGTAPVGSLSIMYVEDDPVTRELVALTLPKRFPECIILTAENGRHGIELYLEHRPDIVITDVNMPVMNGLLMAAEIKAMNPDVAIIAVTAYSETNYLLNAIEIGISNYVLKPIDYKKLFDAVEKSSAGINLRRQFAEQNALISELNICLEQRALEYAATNRELETFSFSVSHDLRGPIANIKGYGQLLQEMAASRLTEQERSFVGSIIVETERMEHLVEGLLEFSRMGNCVIDRQSVNLSSMANEIAANLQRLEPRRRVQFEISDNVTVQGDERLLRAVMVNLLGNAWKFTGRNPDPRIEFGATDNHGVLACFVRDNGVGFEMKQADQLFRTFQRLHDHEEFDGYGIGLATVQRIIQRHGGWIEAAGEVGKGATFTFVI